ncbi:MAG: hypothetical protein IPI73_00330 [Betaproteobacteria bacterium]|nr:hypothetical protein [Betaproteobacteria bacterium]
MVNDPPQAFDVSFAPDGANFVAGYTYWDREGDPELGTTFAWTVEDFTFIRSTVPTNTNVLVLGPNVMSVLKVEVTPRASRGSWPNGPFAYSSDESWELEYGIDVACNPTFLAPQTEQSQCVFSPWVKRPYGLAIPYQLKLGTLNVAYKFTPDSCLFDTIVGSGQIGDQTCSAVLERNTDLADSVLDVQTTASIWINGVYPDGDRVHTTGRNFPRSAPPVPTWSITASVNDPAGGTASCVPNPVAHGNNAACTAAPNAGWEFASWTGHCTGPGTHLHVAGREGL